MKHNYVIICLDSMFETFLVADESMKHNYINICLNSTFDIFWVAGEFIFAQFRDVFEIWMYMSILFGTEITIWVSEGCLEVWAVNCICHISICNVSQSIH